MSIRHLPSAALWLATLILCALAACSEPPVPHASSLDRKALMPIAFEGWQPSKAGRLQLIPEATQSKGKKAEEVFLQVSIEPIYVVKLDESHAVMLTEAQSVDEKNQPEQCHACPSYLGAYFFARDEQGWRLSSRQDIVAEIGGNGHMGKTSIVKLGDQGYVFSSEWGSCWQGYCGDWLKLVALRPDAASVLGEAIPLSANNSGAHPDCSEPATARQTADGPDDQPASDCFDVRSTWKAEGDLIKVSFQGEFIDVDDDGRQKPPRPVRNQATYAVNKGKLVLQAGENPVPGF